MQKDDLQENEMSSLLAQEIVDGLNIFLEMEMDDTTTVGQIIKELIDVDLRVDIQ